MIVLAASLENQALVDYIGEHLELTYTIVRNDNGSVFEVELELKNNGHHKIESTDWEIYFCHIRLIEPATIHPNGTELGSSGFKAFHINGCMHKIAPTDGFAMLRPKHSVTISFLAQYWQVAITDVMPNWYVVTPGATPVVLRSTAGESLSFVTPLTTVEQWKRAPSDVIMPLTPEDRFALNEDTTTIARPDIEVVPMPLEVVVDPLQRITIQPDWECCEDGRPRR